MAILGRMETRDQTEIQVMQVTHGRNIVILPPLILTISSIIIFLSCNMSLNRVAATLLILIYVGYVAFAYVYTGSEEI